MNGIGLWFKGLQPAGKIMLLVLLAGLVVGGKFAVDKWVPKSIKKSEVLKSKVDVPPLAYDAGSVAPKRSEPSFDVPSNVQEVINAPEIRLGLMGWNGQSGIMYAVGDSFTTKGSIAEELGLNVKLMVQNSTDEQANQLYAFIEDYAGGNTNPTKGYTAIAWMADGGPNYLGGLNARITKAFGADYTAQIMDFAGSSFGEDKWLVKPKYMKSALGSLTVCVIRDGDWNIPMLYAKQKGWKVNNDLSTWDPDALNFMPAPNNDYMEAAKAYVSGTPVHRTIVRNGKRMGDTLVKPDCVATWFPGDEQACKQKGGLVTRASTKDYGAQMACGIIFCKKWAADHPEVMAKFCEMVGKGGDQVKSHDDALKFASKVSQAVYADQSMTAESWYNGYKGYTLTDDNGNEVEIGGSRVFNLADAANYAGITGTDKYKAVYSTFGDIDVESYPEIFKPVMKTYPKGYPSYEEATNYTYLRQAYAKNKDNAGTVSKPKFSSGQVTETFASRNYSIQFAPGKSEVLPVSYKVLNDAAQQLTVASNLKIDLKGYTDNTGTDEVNIPLSQSRADAVRNYLINKNPEFAERIGTPAGYGSTKPVDPNADQNNAQVRAANRRVELVLGR